MAKLSLLREIFLWCLGDWLEGSEWTELISATEIRTPGATEAILSAGHVKRTRYVHQVNAVALYILLHQAWEKSESDDIDACTKTKRSSCAQFSYWYTVLELQCILLLFVQSIREANLSVFINSLEKVLPWMFALDHTNYGHLRNSILFIQQLLRSFKKGFLQ